MIALSICFTLFVIMSLLWTMQASRTFDAHQKVISELCRRHDQLEAYCAQLEEVTRNRDMDIIQQVKEHIIFHQQQMK